MHNTVGNGYDRSAVQQNGFVPCTANSYSATIAPNIFDNET